jgi:Zn-dependent protease
MLTGFSIPLFRVAGIPVRLSLWFPVYVVLVLVSTPGFATAEVLLPLLFFFGVILVSVFLHEGGHAFAARRGGLGVGEIQLSLLGGVTTHDPCRNTGQELRVSLAGVAVNGVLALAAGAAFWAIEGSPPGMPRFSWSVHWLAVVWGVNSFLALFNLLPGIPFDGGHAVEALLARKYPRVRARTAVLISGAIIGAGILVMGISNHSALWALLGFSCLSAVGSGYRDLQQGRVEDERLLGAYDFSNGYTSLEKPEPRPVKEPKARVRERERVRLEMEAREAAAARSPADTKERLDRLLDRIAAEGISSLSTEERAFLNDESRRLRDRRRTPKRP